MKKIILTSLLFSLAALVNATPSTITLTANSIDENLAIGTTIGTASGVDGTGNHAYTVQDSNTFSFNVGKVFFGTGNTNNFIVKDINNATHTIAIINFNSTTSADNPATKLADAINAYNTVNNSGISAEAVNATNNGGTVRLTSWPANLDGAELIGFDTSGGKIAITITSTGDDKIIPTPTADFFSIDATTGVLKSEIVFDFEVKSIYTIVIRATDDNGSYAKTFTIDIINDPTDGLMLSSEVVAEHNATATIVGMLATTGGTGSYTYSVATNKNFTFTVQGINNNNPVNNTFRVRPVGSSDKGTGISSIQNYDGGNDNLAGILVDNINSLTSFTTFSAFRVDDTTVRLTDWDSQYDGYEFNGPSPFASDGTTPVNYIAIDPDLILPNPPFSIDGDKLITTAVLDKATQGSYNIIISSTDSASPPATISRDFTITVAEGPSGTVTGITLTPNTINNQAADGTTVGLLSTNATDTGRAYALVDNTATFSISGDKLTANNPGSLTASATYTVSISTYNEATDSFPSYTVIITVTEEKAFSLDVDGNGTINAPNDGLIIFKYLLNSNANNLHTTIASDTPDGRKTTPQLKAYLDDAGTILDVDGNGTINAPNDGLIIFKYLLNSNANNLHTTIASDAPDGKKTTPQLKAYLDLYSE